MKAVLYLFYRDTKNTVARALKNPASLIGYLVFIVFYLWIGIRIGNKKEPDVSIFNTDMFYIMLMFFALIQTFAYVYPTNRNGIVGYRTADITLLFQAPVRTFDILFILLLRQFSSGFFTMAFMLLQVPIFKAVFGLTNKGIILYIFSSIIMNIFGTILMALRVFIFRNKPFLTKVFRLFLFVLLGILFFYPIIPAISHADPIKEYFRAFRLPVIDMIPFFGWMRAVAVSPLTGITPSLTACFFIMLTLCVAGLFYLYRKTDTEWFEESVGIAEQSGIAAETIKKGFMPALNPIKRKKAIHFTFTGRGSAAIFQKHILEYRKTGFMFVNLKSLLFLALGVGLGWLAAKNPGEELPVMLLSLFLISFLSVLFSMFSRWKREAKSPYLYLIPDTPFRKLIMITAASAIKHVIDGLFYFVPVCILSGSLVIEMILGVLAYTILNQTYINVDILSNHIFGRLNAGNLRLLVNYFVQILLFVPAVTVSIVMDIADLPSLFSVLGYIGVLAVFYITLSIYAAGTLRCPEYFD
jgi:hypothetical protein